MSAQDTFQKNLVTLEHLSSRYVKSMQSLIEANLERSKAYQAQSQAAYIALWSGPWELALASLKTTETELKNWNKVWGEVMTSGLGQLEDAAKEVAKK